MSLIDSIKLGMPGRRKRRTFTHAQTTLAASAIIGATTLTLTSVADMSATSGQDTIVIQLDNFNFHQTTIVSINAGAGTVVIAAGLPSAATAGLPVYAHGVYTFTVPAAAVEAGVIYATYCGPGQGGAGGHTSSPGGGGGGGGASSTFRDMPIFISGPGDLTLVVAPPAAGGAPGANGVAGGLTKITGSIIQYPLPTGRCAANASSLPVAGGATNGGKGGDGAPMAAGVTYTATAEVGVESGPLGGTAGTPGVNGGAGKAALRRGYAGTTGGAGGGGGSTTSKGGPGGADDKHGDQEGTVGNESGGAGGGSMLGGAAYGGDPAGDAFGSGANGPGAGGGGGGASGGGGLSGPGVVELWWM